MKLVIVALLIGWGGSALAQSPASEDDLVGYCAARAPGGAEHAAQVTSCQQLARSALQALAEHRIEAALNQLRAIDELMHAKLPEATSTAEACPPPTAEACRPVERAAASHHRRTKNDLRTPYVSF